MAYLTEVPARRADAGQVLSAALQRYSTELQAANAARELRQRRSEATEAARLRERQIEEQAAYHQARVANERNRQRLQRDVARQNASLANRIGTWLNQPGGGTPILGGPTATGLPTIGGFERGGATGGFGAGATGEFGAGATGEFGGGAEGSFAEPARPPSEWLPDVAPTFTSPIANPPGVPTALPTLGVPQSAPPAVRAPGAERRYLPSTVGLPAAEPPTPVPQWFGGPQTHDVGAFGATTGPEEAPTTGDSTSNPFGFKAPTGEEQPFEGPVEEWRPDVYPIEAEQAANRAALAARRGITRQDETAAQRNAEAWLPVQRERDLLALEQERLAPTPPPRTVPGLPLAWAAGRGGESAATRPGAYVGTPLGPGGLIQPTRRQLERERGPLPRGELTPETTGITGVQRPPSATTGEARGGIVWNQALRDGKGAYQYVKQTSPFAGETFAAPPTGIVNVVHLPPEPEAAPVRTAARGRRAAPQLTDEERLERVDDFLNSPVGIEAMGTLPPARRQAFYTMRTRLARNVERAKRTGAETRDDEMSRQVAEAETVDEVDRILGSRTVSSRVEAQGRQRRSILVREAHSSLAMRAMDYEDAVQTAKSREQVQTLTAAIDRDIARVPRELQADARRVVHRIVRDRLAFLGLPTQAQDEVARTAQSFIRRGIRITHPSFDQELKQLVDSRRLTPQQAEAVRTLIARAAGQRTTDMFNEQAASLLSDINRERTAATGQTNQDVLDFETRVNQDQ